MFAFFYGDGDVTINYSLASFGMEGQYSVVGSGHWTVTDGNALEVTISDAAVEVADMGDGTLQFTVGDNTYAVVTADFLAAVGQ